jgi:predicted transcriptional regulator
VSKNFGEWYQKTNNTEDTNNFTSLAFKTIAILHNTLSTTFIQLLETVSKGHMAAIQERVTEFLRSIHKEAFADSFQKLYERC